MPHYHVTKKTETATACILLCDDNIMRVQFKKDTEITALHLEENFNAYKAMVGAHKYPYIYYAEDGSVMYTESARAYSREHEDDFPKLCIAVVVKTLAHKLIANFYLKFNKPGCLFKVFDKMEVAETWCQQQYAASLQRL